jgi:glycosyltransferase involved in cell wall biosynthesis/nucleotide-binding universal stress UspA family protein
MKKILRKSLFRKILVPVIFQCQSDSALALARAVAGEGQIILAGIVYIPDGESLSTAAIPARALRKTLQELSNAPGNYRWEQVRVAHKPWEELLKLVEDEQPDLMVLEWPCHFDALHTTPAEVFAHPPCNLAMACGPVTDCPQRILLPLRGGPYAELSLRLSLSISKHTQASITSLHLLPTGAATPQDAPFRGLDRVLKSLPEVVRQEQRTDDAAGYILAASRQHDLVVMGATARPTSDPTPIGAVAERILRESPVGVVVVKTYRPMPANLESEEAGGRAISVLVDKWFAENTYHADEFEDLQALLALKQKQNLTISLALPALNEEETVSNVIQTIKQDLVERAPLLDEIILIDSDSTDQTREIAASLGVPVYIHQAILPRYGARRGKGEALWKSLYLTRGDIVIWIDTDIVNIHPRFVYGLLGPLLLRPDLQFIKGFYRRPLKVGDKVQAGGGGRVTELTARPLINLFYPELSGVVQPLSGEYGGRRSALEQLPFYSGYGVEIGLLIDVFETFGLKAIAQVDLLERVHHNQPLEALSKMSFTIIQAVIHKLEHRYGRNFLEDVNKTMKLIRYEPGHFFLDVEEIAERERPPMIELPEYRENRRLLS